MTARPTFGQWLRHTWIDILTMVVMGAIGLGVSFCHVHYFTFDFRFSQRLASTLLTN